MGESKDILVRGIPARDVERLEQLRLAWPVDISMVQAVRLAIGRGLDASPELREVANG